MIIKIIAFLNGGKAVTLVDFRNEVYRTIAKKSKIDNEWHAPVYWFYNIGDVILNADGTTGGLSRYIRRWYTHSEAKLDFETLLVAPNVMKPSTVLTEAKRLDRVQSGVTE